MSDSAYGHLDPINHRDGRERSRTSIILSVLLLGCVVAIVILSVRLHNKSSSHGHAAPSNNGGGSTDLYKQLAKTVKFNMDSSVDPCQNFYKYACGGWLKNTTIPPSAVDVSSSFTVIQARNTEILIEQLQVGWPQIGPLYQSCMDLSGINSETYMPIVPYMNLLDTVLQGGDNETIMTASAVFFNDLGFSPFFGADVAVDAKNPTRVLFDIGQGGLSVGDSSFYSNWTNVIQLENHIQRMFILAGYPSQQAGIMASNAARFEYAIANFTLPDDAIRDPFQVYNPYTVAQLKVLAPHIDWDGYFGSFNLTEELLGNLNVDVPNFVKQLDALIAGTPLPTLVAYLRWQVIHNAAPMLSKGFVQENFRFFIQFLEGQQVPDPRPEFCASVADSGLGFLLGRYFVMEAFSGQSQDRIVQLIGLIESAFKARLNTVTWMDATTRARALTKLSQVIDQVGYPTNLTDYSSVEISAQGTDFFNNWINMNRFSAASTINRLYHPSSRHLWEMTPPTVNAYYDPSYNSINFPAGILQPPFFSVDFPAAMNFGGIGMVMGHELTHGFDDQGSDYDGTGKLTTWWTNASRANFESRKECFVNQYSHFTEVYNGKTLHVDGNLTLGENIADNGGIRTAWSAYQLYKSKYGDDKPIDDDIPNDKLFFLAFAQTWCDDMEPQYAAELLDVDPHSPAFARVMGPLSNLQEFSDTFHCKSNTPMNPQNKCVLW